MPWSSPHAIPLAGVYLEVVSSAVGPLVVSTGFCAATLRAAAMLRKLSAQRVEWMTAVGFTIGLLFGASILALDLVLG
jgi:hypothetical protein